jgi:MFS family permease
VAREHAHAAPVPPRGTSWARVAAAVRERPVLLAATAGLATAHAVMVSVMVMTPLHMEHGGAELRVIGLVISVHVLGMFAFAPVSGWAADRLGRATTVALGGVVLLVSLFLSGRSPEGSSWQIFAGLFLLGFGWSLATVASSTLIAEYAPLESRPDIQGAADLVMNVAAALAGGVAGVIVGAWGYASLNAFAALIAAGTLAAAAGARASLARRAALREA